MVRRSLPRWGEDDAGGRQKGSDSCLRRNDGWGHRDDKVGGLVATGVRLLRFATLPRHDETPDRGFGIMQ